LTILEESLQRDGELIARALTVVRWWMKVSWIEIEMKEKLCNVARGVLSTKPEVCTYSPRREKYLGSRSRLFQKLWSNR
jgi:hypothetical protein